MKVISKNRNVEFDEGRHFRAKLGFILMSTDLERRKYKLIKTLFFDEIEYYIK